MAHPSGPTVLLPLDGSELAERAMWLAVEIVDRMTGHLLIINVPEVYGLDPAWYSGATIDLFSSPDAVVCCHDGSGIPRNSASGRRGRRGRREHSKWNTDNSVQVI